MPLILGTNSIKDTGYDVANSLRFNDGSSDFLSFTQGTATSRKTFSISVWVKRANLSAQQQIFETWLDNNNRTDMQFTASDKILLQQTLSGSTSINIETSRLFRDVSAWYHILAVFNTTESTSSDRVKLYINGVQETSFSPATYPSLNADLALGTSSYTNFLGKYSSSGGNYFDGYMAEYVFTDGTALSNTDVGEFDEDSPTIWKPIDVSGLTFGTNGFYLDFENSGSLGADVSGNGNNFTVNNLTSIDQSTDTCTNNFCTLNPLTLQDSDFVLSEGNLKISIGGNNERKAVLGTFGLTSGKWYYECKYISTSGQAFSQIGISDIIQGTEASSENGKMGYFPYDYGYRGELSSGSGGLKTNNGTYTSYGDAWTTDDIIGVAFDLDNNAIYFAKNGAWQASGDPTSGASRTNAAYNITAAASTGTGAYFPAIGKEDADDPIFEFNFGNPTFSISSGNADGNGYGNFEYAVPSGYYSLNTKNLAEFG